MANVCSNVINIRVRVPIHERDKSRKEKKQKGQNKANVNRAHIDEKKNIPKKNCYPPKDETRGFLNYPSVSQKRDMTNTSSLSKEDVGFHPAKITTKTRSRCDEELIEQLLEEMEEEHPVALITIIGGANTYHMPNEKTKRHLKRGLREIVRTAPVWMITEGKDTGVGKIVEEINRGKSKYRVFHQRSETTTIHENDKRKRQEDKLIQLLHENNDLETNITEQLHIPSIVIMVGGEKESFDIAMGYLDRNVPVLVIEGSGSAADFICKGYTIFKYKHEYNLRLFDTTFPTEMLKAANNIWIKNVLCYADLADKLYCALLMNRQLIHMYSSNDTTCTLDRAIQNVLFKILCNEEEYETSFQSSLLHFVDLWNRPDIAAKAVFNSENRKVLMTLQDTLGIKYSDLSELFTKSLLHDKVDFVLQILEYIQDKEPYKLFLNHSLHDLYQFTGCIAGHYIYMQDKRKEKHIVEKINKAVQEILGGKCLKPFNDANKTSADEKIPDSDIFKHLFIWAVIVDRRQMALIFWKKQDRDYICSALYASGLAKMLAENSISEEYMDLQTNFLESSRYYEDLAYSVMTELYLIDKTKARQLLVTELRSYNSTTIFEITEKFTLMKFMGHAACQTKLNKIWMGRIFSETSFLKACFAAFIPYLIMQILSYTAMLVLFSLFVLTDLYPISEQNPSVKECVIYAWAASTLLEEIRQAFVIKQMSLNLMTWFSFWTLFEIGMYIMFTSTVFLRFTLSAENFYHARMMYAITLGLFIINTMQFFLVSKHIGPKVIMIGKMMFDFLFFLLIFAVFLFGFGVIYQATMYPNSTPGFGLFKDIIYMPYWQLYGELFLDELQGKEPSICTNDASLHQNQTIYSCPEVNQINIMLLGVYMVITHIILVNILIAMFSHTFTKVQNNNQLVWKFHRFSLIREYYDRSSLVPPFIIISHLKRIIICIFRECRDKKKDMFKIKSTTTEHEELAILEEDAVHQHFNSSAFKEESSMTS